MTRVGRTIGLALLFVGIAAGLPALTLVLTVLIQILTDRWYCAPSNWPVC